MQFDMCFLRRQQPDQHVTKAASACSSNERKLGHQLLTEFVRNDVFVLTLIMQHGIHVTVSKLKKAPAFTH
jgi:hypothetical protein